jgi:hypothetical protein
MEFSVCTVCRTRTVAERKAAEKLQELGINSIQTFRESTSYITTGDTPWTTGCIPSSVSGTLADITNLAMKGFVDHISSLKPATIRDYVNTVKTACVRGVQLNRLFGIPKSCQTCHLEPPSLPPGGRAA